MRENHTKWNKGRQSTKERNERKIMIENGRKKEKDRNKKSIYKKEKEREKEKWYKGKKEKKCIYIK